MIWNSDCSDKKKCDKKNCEKKLVQEKFTNKYGEKKYIQILELSFCDFVLLKIKNVTENLLNNFSKVQKPKFLQNAKAKF